MDNDGDDDDEAEMRMFLGAHARPGRARSPLVSRPLCSVTGRGQGCTVSAPE